MNEASSSSSLAITEKKPSHRSGGCVGIFFQLFDWNRRLAKKKLFSKKLLPPARAKQASKKFGGNEKLSTPKLHLIADENRGGFPNVKKDNGIHGGVGMAQKHETQSPSLVARLMGLESMPTSRKDKLKKTLDYETCNDQDWKYVGNRNGSYMNEDVILDKGLVKHELRPEKLQKTGQSDRKAVTRFGSETLQFKNVLSRSRKNQHHHPPKLVSPVKSPRVLSGKNASRWIDAATKILEPGLQATNKAKCALTYSKDKVMIEKETLLSPEIVKPTAHYTNTKSLFLVQSCENCGNSNSNDNLSDVVILRPNIKDYPKDYPSIFGYPISSYANDSSGKERAMNFQIHDQAKYNNVSKARDTPRNHNDEPFRDEAKTFSTNGQERWHFTSQPRKPLKDERTPIALKHISRTPSQMSLSRERIATKSKLNSMHHGRKVLPSSNNAAKDFVAFNRSLSGRTRSKIPNKIDKSNLVLEGDFCNLQDDPSSHPKNLVRKRRTVNAGGQIESAKLGLDALSMNYNSSSNKNGNAISFVHKSPVKKKTVVSSQKIENRGNKNDLGTCPTSSSQNPLLFSEDALGALLAQKLKELNCQEEDEYTVGENPPKRTTAVILQELICALTAEQPISQNDEPVGIGRNGRTFNGNKAPQVRRKTTRTATGILREWDHFSPGSVLEASFSTDSCISSSVDDNSGHRMHMNELEFADSAISFQKTRSESKTVMNVVPKILPNISNVYGVELSGTKIRHVKEVIINSELLFSQKFSVGSFLETELECLGDYLWRNCNCLGGFEELKENSVKEFILDCVIEYLESKNVRWFKRLPSSQMSSRVFMRGVGEEVTSWREQADDHSLGKWSDYDIEAFETGAQIDELLLHLLLDEILTDLCHSACQ